jgi:murein L,D-transpeptidase YafK
MLTSAALAAAIALAGCNADDLARDARANKPIPPKLVAEISEKNMEKESPILVRIFKQESELEVWKQDRTGRYALLKTYPICRWSGELGPKIREGDRQAPEGFYTITPGQMNPNSSYYLAFNMGYPNAFDKSLGRTGSQLMVHGDCSSRGCYAMTDEQISEIYSLGRESFFGGQRAFQVQAYPFRMNPVNMAKHRANPHMPFWKMIKRGYDHFEVTRLEPKVDVCEKQYVFDAAQPDGAVKPLSFNAAGKCPTYNVPEEIAQAVAEKTRGDERQVAELVSRGTPSAPVKMGLDGGMHPVFASKLGVQNAGTGDSAAYSVAAYKPAPGTIPAHVNPPRSAHEPQVAVSGPVPANTSAPVLGNDSMQSTSIQTASTSTPATPAPRTITSSARSEPSVFDRVASAVGFAPKETSKDASAARTISPPASQPASSQPARNANAAVNPAPRPAAPVARTNDPTPRATASVAPRSAPAMRGTTGDDDKKPAASQASAQSSSGSGTSGNGNSTTITSSSAAMAGAQPIRPAASFDSRWSAFR